MGGKQFNMNWAHRLNLGTTVIMVLLIVSPLIYMYGFSKASLYIMVGILILGLAAVNYFLKIPDRLKGIIFAMLPAVVTAVLFFIDGYAINKHYFLFISVIMAALYFDRAVTLIHWGVINILMLGLYFGAAENFLAQNNELPQFIIVYAAMNGCQYMIYRLSKWGRAIIQETQQKQQEATEVMEDLKGVLQAISEGSVKLSTNVNEVSGSLQTMNTISGTILQSAQQIAESIQEEAEMAQSINKVMQASMKKIDETAKTSALVVADSKHMNEAIVSSWEKVNLVTNHMDTLHGTIHTTTNTVDDLQESLTKVNYLLGGIKDIADQTNLLALNAAIEAARAGEHGKGFAVVAEEVRKLAEQSAQTASQITEVTGQLFAKSGAAQSQVHAGKAAVEEGAQLLEEIAQAFDRIKVAFNGSTEKLTAKVGATHEANEEFQQVVAKIEQLAAVSEESTALTAEIVSAISEENEMLSSIAQVAEELEELNEELRALSSKI